jgi:hypothetical protein
MGATEAEIPIPADSIEASTGEARDTSPDQNSSENGTKNLDITIIPPCIVRAVLQTLCATSNGHTVKLSLPPIPPKWMRARRLPLFLLSDEHDPP